MRDIEHGTSHGYATRGCRCDQCKTWMRLQGRERRIKATNPGGLSEFREMLGTYGEEYTQYVPADIAIEVLQKLKDEWGIPLSEITKQVGCDYSTIHSLYHNRTRNNSGRIKWDLAGKIYGAEGWFEAERECAR